VAERWGSVSKVIISVSDYASCLSRQGECETLAAYRRAEKAQRIPRQARSAIAESRHALPMPTIDVTGSRERPTSSR